MLNYPKTGTDFTFHQREKLSQVVPNAVPDRTSWIKSKNVTAKSQRFVVGATMKILGNGWAKFKIELSAQVQVLKFSRNGFVSTLMRVFFLLFGKVSFSPSFPSFRCPTCSPELLLSSIYFPAQRVLNFDPIRSSGYFREFWHSFLASHYTVLKLLLSSCFPALFTSSLSDLRGPAQ